MGCPIRSLAAAVLILTLAAGLGMVAATAASSCTWASAVCATTRPTIGQ